MEITGLLHGWQLSLTCYPSIQIHMGLTKMRDPFSGVLINLLMETTTSRLQRDLGVNVWD